VNARYRIYAAAGLAGALLLSGGFLVLGRGQASTTTEAHVIKPLHPVKKKTAAKTVAAKPKPKPAHKPKRDSRPFVRKTQPTDGMPAAVAAALAQHPVVVVSLIAPDAAVDDLAYQEARAGARAAHAGFVRISAADNADVQALSTLVNSSSSASDRLLDAPAVFVFSRPHDLFVRFNGFIDADTVAQAASNAAPVAPVLSGKSSLADPWVAGANSVCRQLDKQLSAAPLPTSTAEYLPYVKRQVAMIHVGIAKIRALKPPAGKAAKVREMLGHYDAMVAVDNAVLAAAKRGNLAKIQRIFPRIRTERLAGDEIAAALGANDCALDLGES
jgi:hypothetical protein